SSHRRGGRAGRFGQQLVPHFLDGRRREVERTGDLAVPGVGVLGEVAGDQYPRGELAVGIVGVTQRLARLLDDQAGAVHLEADRDPALVQGCVVEAEATRGTGDVLLRLGRAGHDLELAECIPAYTGELLDRDRCRVAERARLDGILGRFAAGEHADDLPGLARHLAPAVRVRPDGAA